MKATYNHLKLGLITYILCMTGLSALGYDGIFNGTVAEARALKGHSYTTLITTDHGGGIWYYDNKDTKAPDNTGTVLVDASGKRWKRIYDGYINVRWFGAKGNGISDDSKAIDLALNYVQSLNISSPEGIDASFSLRGGTLFFSSGKYKYAGNGWTHSQQQSKNIRILGEGRDATSILIQNDIYFLSIADVNSLQLEDITFIGGLGTFRQTARVSQVRRLYIIERCVFKDFKECAIGSNSTDMPNWKIANCQFYGDRNTKNATIGIALSGLNDMDEVHGNEFLYCQYGIKLDRGGNSAKIYNNFFSTAQSNDGNIAANIWIVANKIRVNAGSGLEIRSNKFGIELTNENSTKILIADQDLAKSQVFYLSPPLHQVSKGYVQGMNVEGNLFAGFTKQKHGLLYSYTENIDGIFWGPSNSLQGSSPRYIFEFSPQVKAHDVSKNNTVFLPHSSQFNEPGYAINLSNVKGFAKYIDVMGLKKGDPDVQSSITPETDTFDNIQIKGTNAGHWNGTHLIMGDYHVWVDANGKMRIKNSAPKFDADGSQVR
jgi:hypothetical protein